MATQSLPQNPRNELESLLKSWEARWRFKMVMLYLPRIIIAAFGIGVVLSFIVALFGLMTANGLVNLVLLLVPVTIIVLCLGVAFSGKRGMASALRFDTLFNLQERLTTAFELMDGRIKTVDELADLQLKDTLSRAQAIDPRKVIHLEWRKLEWAGALLMGFLLFVLLGIIFVNGLVAESMGAGTQAAIDAAAATAQDVTELVATDSTLSAEDRQALLDSTERTLAELQNPDTTAEDSFAAMNDLAADLNAEAQELREDIANSEAGLTSASASLGSSDSDFTANPDQLAQQLNDMSDAVSTMTPEEQAAAAEDLREAADAVREENPELAEQLDEAAAALENANTSGAMEALGAAAQEASSAQLENAESAESAQQMEDAASEAQQAARDIATSEYNENAQTNGEVDPNTTIEEQLGMEEPEMEAMPGEDGGGGEGEEPSQGTQGDLTESDDPNARPADTQGNAEGQVEDGQGQGEESNAGAGAGEGEAPQTNEVQGGSAQSEVSNMNNTDGEGESEYEEVYAPVQENTVEGEEDIVLETTDGQEPAVEGDFQENPEGQSNVPYNEVFTDYADEANRALESGYVPLGVRDVVRDYFTSIEPTGGE